MRNSNEDTRIRNISAQLRLLRKKVNNLLALVPDLMSIDNIDEITPEKKREAAYPLLFSLLACHDPQVNKSGLLASMIPVKHKGIFDWYQNRYPLIHRKITDLLVGKVQSAFEKSQKLSAPARNDCDSSIRSILIQGMGFLRSYSDDRDDAHFPIAVNQMLGGIPLHIRERVNEICRSFHFQNWIAVIAMSRCLLEYALVERRHILKIEVYTNEQKTQTKKLVKLIADSKNVFPELGKSMESIRVAGNGVMHPPSAKIERLDPDKDIAEKCVEDITKIIGALYNE